MSDPTESEQIRAEILALPVGTVLSIGWRTPSGRVQGPSYLRVGDGVRYAGALRDEDARSTLNRELMARDVAFAVTAVPVSEIARLTAERDEARQDAACAREWEQIAKAEAARLREALRRACHDGWADGDGAMEGYLADVLAALPAEREATDD